MTSRQKTASYPGPPPGCPWQSAHSIYGRMQVSQPTRLRVFLTQYDVIGSQLILYMEECKSVS